MAGEIPTITRAELEELQLERLRETLRRAHDHVPHYRRAFADAGVAPDDLRALSDLARFPFTTKADLRANYPFGMFAVPRQEVARVHASSGTTGKPTVVGYTAGRPRHLGRGDGPVDPRRRWRRPGTSCTSPTATASSPAGSAPTTARSGSAARSCRSAAG